ncbi:MAG: peptidylprolyl isomerase [Myxococcota bacterium]
MSMTLEEGRVGLLMYALFDEEGAILDGTTQGRLFAYLHGHGNLPEALEKVLEGMTEGTNFDETVSDAFGPKTDVEPQRVRRNDLPKDVRDKAAAGMPFAAPGSDGTVHQLWITKVQGASVYLTPEHPLAGKTVRFTGQVTRVREATPAELDHGYAHGADGRRPRP